MADEEKENRMSSPAMTQTQSSSGSSGAMSTILTCSSSSTAEPNTSQSTTMNESKLSSSSHSQQSSASSCTLDLRLEETESQQIGAQPEHDNSEMTTRLRFTPGFSQENETECVGPSQDEALSQSVLLPASKRPASPKDKEESQKKLKVTAVEDERSDDDMFEKSDEDGEKQLSAGDLSSNKSIVIESPQADKKDKPTSSRAIKGNDDSVVILDEVVVTATNKSKEVAEVVDLAKTSPKKELPKLRMPGLAADGIAQNNSSSSSPNSESPFTKLAARPRGEVHDKSSSWSTGKLERSNVSAGTADDEESGRSLGRVREGLNSSSGSPQVPVIQGLMIDSPNISVSPIEHHAGTGNMELRRSRISSTPGAKATSLKKRVVAVRQAEISRSSDDEFQQSGNKKRRKTSPKKYDEFKMPKTVEAVSFLFIGGKSGIKPDQVEGIKKLLGGIVCEELSVPMVKASAFHASVLNVGYNFMHGSPESQHRRPSRLSDASTTSSMSKSSSASGGGYEGSGESSLSGGSKRDRLSIVPEASVERHSVVAPLPAASRKVKKSGKPGKSSKKNNEDKEDTKVSTESISVPEEQAGGSKAAKVSQESDSPDFQEGVAVTSSPVDAPESVSSADPSSVVTGATDLAENLPENLPVFAKFIERTQFRYWPAVVKKKAGDDKWLVQFDDGVERKLPVEELIPMKDLIPGNAVFVKSEEEAGLCHRGILSSFPDMSQGTGKISYEIKFDKIEGIAQIEERLVCCSQIFLTGEQAKEIKGHLGGIWATPILSKADLDVSNVIHTPRTRQRPQSYVASPISTPTTRATAKTPTTASSTRRKKRGGEYVETSAGETTDAETAQSKPDETKSGRRRLQSSTDDEKEVPKSTKAKRKGRKAPDHSEFLFKDMSFILTQGTRKSNADEFDITAETETEDSDHNRSFNDGPIFSRKELAKTITEHGGHVLECFPGPNQTIPSNITILSDHCCETMTYLLAVAYGFPRINYQWVTDSVRQKKKAEIKNYHLPVGVSTVGAEPRDIEHHEVKVLTEMLKGSNILVTSTIPSFILDWKPLLARLGASVYSRMSGKIDRGLKTVYLVLADRESPSSILDDAKKKRIPIVSPKWLIQSLINGTSLNPAKFAIQA